MESTPLTTSVPPTALPDDLYFNFPATVTSDDSAAHTITPSIFRELPEPDVHILASGGLRIPAHSGILASISPVLEHVIDRPRKKRTAEKVISILGVPSDAVVSFVRFLYSSRCSAEHLEKHGIHLLALSHVYMVPQLKAMCTKDLAQRLTIESVVDVLQLARLCNAPDLYLKCMKFVADHFKFVEKTEGWKFIQDHDPWLELDILQFIDETESRKQRNRRIRKERKLYLELHEAMECLEHICSEGCTIVGPSNVDPKKEREPCSHYSTCHGLQLLIKHFATCKKRTNSVGCGRCKRMWQLLKLHSSICDHSECCKVPLCRKFKQRSSTSPDENNKRKDDAQWKMLVRKVVSAKAISSLSLTNKKLSDLEEDRMIGHRGIGSFRLQSVRRYRS
ncbi:BTB/POZ and TAZ domain-containing protein 1 [Cucumis melo var. makuwa]|uniref:BTB/POZ and TAZ domain-containing protein 1-like n=2 Tax=Cucumis melo TaxID=3656 RepID=A0A1S3AXY6_CUCME|nr:BTB/POZ and TAZ domain-containing protein 1-like [Cucumis melo]KAA0055289.1 BTB/POZ and TAZ domain-containing protein 1 [Cucumis melo var. makuwa]TYJ99212.1 BTB/POZ and TAZ domain-containing protein 1 [Cucumis melo var. makuwa]